MATRRSSSASVHGEELWRVGLVWLREANQDGTHPLDRKRAINLARGMRMIGENPDSVEVNAQIRRLWSGHPPAAAMTRECWRAVYRVRTSIGRTHLHEAPLYQPDRLIENYQLEPSTEERLEAVALEAVRNLSRAAAESAVPPYLQQKRDLEDALTAIHHLRYLRLGPQSLGVRGLESETPRRPTME
jgi:hypothetical protein